MGMPISISSYTVLTELSKPSNDHLAGRVYRALKPFNLFAFVIHDPVRHKDLDRVLARQFDRLDFRTGRRLLFFALVDPPKEWLEHGSHREYYQLFERKRGRPIPDQALGLINPQNTPRSIDRSITAFSIATTLNIANDDLPCIIVTESFQLNKFLWFKTCPNHIEEQLSRLGYLAERMNKPILNYSHGFPELDLCSGYGTKLLNGSLAEYLSDMLSFVIANTEKDQKVQSIAETQARETIANLYLNINLRKQRVDVLNRERMDWLCVLINSYLALLGKRKSPSLIDFININREFLENDTYQILRTAQMVYELLVSHRVDKYLPSETGEELDYTPGLVCLAKVFEKEANLSIVHWARNQLGVELPRYFYLPQPGIKAKIIPQFEGGREIDLNKRKDQKWWPPALGESKLACRELTKKNRPPIGWTKRDLDTLFRLWDIIREERNKAVHDKLIGEASLLKVKDTLQDLSNNGIFEKFYQLKKKYRGEVP
jgi:hypothetical protein